MSVRLVLLLVALIGASNIWTYHFADKNVRNELAAEKVPALEKSIETHNTKAVAGNKVEKSAVDRAKRIEAIFAKLEDEVQDYAQKHADSNCGLDPDGLRTWRAANAGTSSEAEALATSLSDAGLRRPATAADGVQPGPVEKPRPGGRAVPPVPGMAPRTGEVARGEQ